MCNIIDDFYFQAMAFFMMLALYAFICRLSDPRHGGTYMTIFNTFYYLGFVGIHSIVLKLVDFLTFSQCSSDSQNYCSTTHLKHVILEFNTKFIVYMFNGYK